MAIIVELSEVQAFAFVRKVREGIENGLIDTWSFDEDGDFTHTPSQWRYNAWFRPRIMEGATQVQFGIVKSKNVLMTKNLYAVYHGRFAEMLLAHFDDEIKSLSITPKLKPGVDVY